MTEEKSINFFSEALNSKITIKLNDGLIIKGELKLIDSLMNLVLQNAIEYNGNKKEVEYEECFIRGNNSLFFFLLKYYIINIFKYLNKN